MIIYNDEIVEGSIGGELLLNGEELLVAGHVRTEI
jgi:hypothetical protein